MQGSDLQPTIPSPPTSSHFPTPPDLAKARYPASLNAAQRSAWNTKSALALWQLLRRLLIGKTVEHVV
ncbi:hypothetical protein HBI17_072050 [Parastagonospora nodorum]|nr:hypothetical protein HBI79_015920 [Parastagonospora nodorum]KAH5322240.1 hypothetical protein HBI12_094190 [Parastagonospora nodorum]KAH5615883.1 hypothetical protein HBI45_020760 [Parastagonospora nodorum]KAH5756699.1 hypothetical protein HBI17_072050 [Parastagonospora nodorum]KAH6431808.1 hypothetical protein HBI14_033600 [Parastagonospora nodorum]